MRNTLRLERLIAAAAGVYMLFVPLFTEDSSDNASIWVAEVVGAAIALSVFAALTYGFGKTYDVTEALLGAALFAAPWIFGYSDLSGAAGNAWVVGALMVVAAAVGYFSEGRTQQSSGRHLLQH